MQHQININNPFLSDDRDAIVALCTPRGSGSLALIRVSGDNALSIVTTISRLSSGSTMSSVATHTIHHGYVVDDDEKIDEVMFLVMHGPKTFTGHDTVEITCHNNTFIIENILDCAVRHGARYARPGEFAKRAVVSGKIDLLQAEAINDLINAPTQAAVRRSLSAVNGSLSQAMEDIEKKIVHTLSYVEASFEFLDEEQRDLDFDCAIKRQTSELLEHITDMCASFSQQRHIKEGVRIALVGMVNVGKSTLFNALVGHERAIVADIEGTTRDTIEAGLYKNGTFLLLIDTAGMRKTSDVIEQQGIERSISQAAMADIVVFVVDASSAVSEDAQAYFQKCVAMYADKMIIVLNKIDIAKPDSIALHIYNDAVPIVKLSAKHAHGIEILQNHIKARTQQLFAELRSPFLINQRQFKLLTEIRIKLENIANSYFDGIHYELIAYQLRSLLENVSELTGKNVSERILDTVFDEFCVGK